MALKQNLADSARFRVKSAKQPPQNRQASGLEAERKVSETLLELLTDGYLILNDIKYRYGNIDHVVVRPDGTIFLCETKSHKGTVTSDGKRILVNGKPLKTSPISQVMRSIRWIRVLAKQLSGRNPWIVAVVVFPNANAQIHRAVKRVNVLTLEDLPSFIRSYSAKRGHPRHKFSGKD